MTKQEIIEFLNKNVACTLATIDGDKPRVRGIMTYRADENGVIFHTGDFKDFFKQLQKNPNVELCYLADNIQIRVSGTARIENDMELKEKIISERPFLKAIIEKHGKDSIKVFRVHSVVATVWTMANNLAPKEYVRF